MDIILEVLKDVYKNENIIYTSNTDFYSMITDKPFDIPMQDDNINLVNIVFAPKYIFEINKYELPIHVISNVIYYNTNEFDDPSMRPNETYYEEYDSARHYLLGLDKKKLSISLYKYFNTDKTTEEIDKYMTDLIDATFSEELRQSVKNYIFKDVVENKQRLEQWRASMNDYKAMYYNACKEIDKLMKLVYDTSDGEEEVINSVFKIKNHKKVIDLEIIDGRLNITTLPIVLTEPKVGVRFQLGTMRIVLPLRPSNRIYIYGDKMYSNYFGRGVHPHIDTNGSPCWGTADAQIAAMINERNYYAAFLTILGYLETCNIEDCAGALVYRYPPIGMSRFDMMLLYEDYVDIDSDDWEGVDNWEDDDENDEYCEDDEE